MGFMRQVILFLLCCFALNIEAQSEKKIIEVNLENDYVKRYLDEVVNTPGMESQVLNYLPVDGGVRADFPNPVVLRIPVFNSDTLITEYRDTLYFAKTDTLIQTRIDTICHVVVEGIEHNPVDSLIKITQDTIISKRHEISYTVNRDTLVTIPEDTLRVYYSLRDDYQDAETVEVMNGQQELSIYNLIPQRVYYYKVEVNDSLLDEGEIHTMGRVRMIYVPSIINVRDMGGWETEDNKRIKYGKLFRGGELNGEHIADSVDIQRLLDLGVGAEIDLRAWYDDGSNTTAFNFIAADSVPQGDVPTYLYTNSSGQLPDHMTTYYLMVKWRDEFNFIVNNLKKGRGVYQHCVWGRDRTGYLSLLLEGLLGVGYDNLIKDYELTVFAYYGGVKKNEIDQVIAYLNTMEGETLADKINYYFVKKLYVTQSNIDYFREVMLEDTSSDEVITDINERESVGSQQYETFYDMMGRRVSSIQKEGIYILRDNNHSTQKIIGR